MNVTICWNAMRQLETCGSCRVCPRIIYYPVTLLTAEWQNVRKPPTADENEADDFCLS